MSEPPPRGTPGLTPLLRSLHSNYLRRCLLLAFLFSPLAHSTSSQLSNIKRGRYGNMFLLQSREPTYTNGNYRLNFHGRVTVPSVKNFQLVSPDDKLHTVCQFGKASTRYTRIVSAHVTPLHFHAMIPFFRVVWFRPRRSKCRWSAFVSSSSLMHAKPLHALCRFGKVRVRKVGSTSNARLWLARGLDQEKTIDCVVDLSHPCFAIV